MAWPPSAECVTLAGVRPVLAACLALGCASVDLDLAVERGQARWYAATGLRPVPLSVAWSSSRVCGSVTAAVGCAHLDGSVWIWTGVLTQAEADRVMLHELGHVLAPGRGHVGPWGGVMAARLDDSTQCITQLDIDLVCLGFLCAWERPELPCVHWLPPL